MTDRLATPNVLDRPPDVGMLMSVGELLRDLPLTRAHLKSGCALLVTFIIEAWEMVIIIYAGAAIGREFPMSPVQLGSLVGAMFIGMMLGSPGWGVIADRS